MWLTFPVGFDAKQKHAVLQVIHGGPLRRGRRHLFVPLESACLCRRRAVVAQVNYHGSSGFG